MSLPYEIDVPFEEGAVGLVNPQKFSLNMGFPIAKRKLK